MWNSLRRERRCLERNRRSLAGCPYFSCLPFVQMMVMSGVQSPGSVCVYRDEEELPRARDAISSLVGALAVTDNNHAMLVGGKVISFCSGMLPKYFLSKFRVSAKIEERKAARCRVIASWSRRHASGGYPSSQNPVVIYPSPIPVLVLHTGCPQLHNADESVEFLSRSGGVDESLLCSAWKKVCTRVLRAACHESQKSNLKVHLKIPPLGAFLYHTVYGARCPRGKVVECALRGLQSAVTELLPLGLSLRVSCIELPDFTREGFYTPEESFVLLCKKCGLDVISGWKMSKDALDPSSVLPGSVMAVAIAGDPLALPGNRRGYVSVESMVANNTSFRRDASWVYNPALVDPRYHSQLAGALLGENRSPVKSSSSRDGRGGSTGAAAGAAAGASAGAGAGAGAAGAGRAAGN